MDIQIDQKSLNLFARECGARFVALYGSRATGNFTEESDTDVAVFFESGHIPRDFGTYANVTQKLGEILRIGATSIDFVILNRANILLRYEITAKGKLLYGDENEYEQYRAFAFREYHDARSLFELEDILIRKRQKLIKEAAAL